MLGLDQQVGGEAPRVGSAVGDHHALGRSEQHHRRHPVALHLDLGEGHRRRPGADDHPHLGDRLRAEPHGGDTCRTVDAKHVGDPQLATYDEDCRIDGGVVAPRDRRNHEHDLGDTSRRGRRRQLVGDTGVARFAGRNEQADRIDSGQLLADDQSRLGLEAPVGEAGELVLAEGADVGDRIVDRRVDLRRHRSRLDLVGGDAQLGGFDGDTVEALERSADGVIAARAHVVDQLPDRRPQLGIEDGIESAAVQRSAVGLVHVCPPRRPHDRGHGSRRYRPCP